MYSQKVKIISHWFI